jgi:uncharacterized protein YndB with AHSA1/START domain
MKTITWKIHLRSAVDIVYDLLTSPEGREKFWAEEAKEANGIIHFVFPNGARYNARIIRKTPNSDLHIDYFNSQVKITLEPTADGGTVLILENENVPESDYAEVYAGWVSVLLNLKSVADFQHDLRNHHPARTWDQGYADN